VPAHLLAGRNRTVGLVIGIIVAVVAVLIVLWLIGGYNGLVRSRNSYKNAFSQIDVQLQRRFDLIPNLVETAKGYMAHERETLEAVTQARAAAVAGLGAAKAAPGDPAAMQQLAQSQGALAGALGRFTAVAEQYPDLKASQNMMQLSEELTSTENKVAFSRQAYNDSVMTYNTKRESFPTSVLAGMFHFEPAALWDIAPEHPETREAPKVQF
jgi:LemA protein